MLEHIVASNLTKHLANSNILFELQHGFREKRSCETQLVMLVDEISKSMQMGKQTDLILLDFSKAFDIDCKLEMTLLPPPLGGILQT